MELRLSRNGDSLSLTQRHSTQFRTTVKPEALSDVFRHECLIPNPEFRMGKGEAVQLIET